MSTLASNHGTAKMAAWQFLMLGEDPPGVRLELTDGEIVVSASPTPDHSVATLELAMLLMGHIKSLKLGQLFTDVDTLVSPLTIRRPDLLYFQKDRVHLVGEKYVEGPPDLCVEVVSPGSETTDRKLKFNQYRRFGVLHYWLVDPRKRTIEAYELRGRSYVLAGRGSGQQTVHLPPFPELDIPLGRLWRPRGNKR